MNIDIAQNLERLIFTPKLRNTFYISYVMQQIIENISYKQNINKNKFFKSQRKHSELFIFFPIRKCFNFYYSFK